MMRAEIDGVEAELGVDLSRSWVVGDRLSDLKLAWAVGARGALVKSGYGLGEWEHHAPTLGRAPDLVAEQLFEAVERIVHEGEPRA
jgi:D-glycero-D-manno-heptose 1,7-bisphosphate phosphatase